MNKKRKGQAFSDLIIVVVLLLAVAFAFIIIGKANKEVTDELTASNFSQGVAEAQVIVTNTGADFPALFDNVFLILLVGLWIMLIVSSMFIDAHPVFFVVTIVLLVVVFVLSGLLAGVFQEVMDDTDMGSEAGNYPKISWVFNNFLLVVIIIGLSAAVALYGKVAS